MAFDPKSFDLGPMAAKGTPKLARYRSTTDNLAAVDGAGYFDNSIASRLLEVGDIIQVAATDGATFRRVSVKTSNTDITTAALSA